MRYLLTPCKECCQVWIFKENKSIENTGRGADDVLAVSSHHQPNGRLVNKWFHWLLYCLLHHFLPHLVENAGRIIVFSLFTILVKSNCERMVGTLDCLSPSLYYVFIVSHACNVQWLTIFSLFIKTIYIFWRKTESLLKQRYLFC